MNKGLQTIVLKPTQKNSQNGIDSMAFIIYKLMFRAKEISKEYTCKYILIDETRDIVG